jgi:hypothetical protein
VKELVIAEVIWDDHAFYQGDYDGRGLVTQRSVGYVAKETKNTIRLAQSYQADGKKSLDVIVIDKRTVRLIRRLTDGSA